MLNFFSNGELPGGVEGPFASRDVTSFYEIWQAAQQIEATCLMQRGRLGWAAEGVLSIQHCLISPLFFCSPFNNYRGIVLESSCKPIGGREAVGVFLWATDSLENQRVPQGEPTSLASIDLAGPAFNLSSDARVNVSNQ